MLLSKRWIAAVWLALVALLGLYGAADSGQGSGYVLGLTLFVLSIGSLFLIIKRHFDGANDEQMFEIFPHRVRNLWLLLILLCVTAIGSLGLASSSDVLYSVGIALFAVCCLMGFRVIGLAFDRRKRH